MKKSFYHTRFLPIIKGKYGINLYNFVKDYVISNRIKGWFRIDSLGDIHVIREHLAYTSKEEIQFQKELAHKQFNQLK